MNLQQKSNRLVAVTVAGVMAALVMPSAPSFAQADDATVQPLEDLKTQDNRDPFSSNSDYTGVFDLYHRMQLGIGGNLNEFTRQQGELINDEAALFRERQRQLLQQQQQTPSVPPVESGN